ncbi:MAG: glyoxalase superfamily protein [Bauldia litoralis]
MRSFLDAKAMARSLRAAMARRQVDLTHAEALEIVAAQFGFDDWNILAARIREAGASGEIAFTETAPILRIFDEDKARDFYIGFLGFTLDWEHRFGDNFPLYAQVSRAGLVLHLSGHHGDATPGATVFVRMKGVRAFQAELAARDYTHNKPGIEEVPWGVVTEVTDPFSNRIRFCESPGD